MCLYIIENYFFKPIFFLCLPKSEFKHIIFSCQRRRRRCSDIIIHKHAFIVVHRRDNNRLGRAAKNRERNLCCDLMVLNLTRGAMCIRQQKYIKIILLSSSRVCWNYGFSFSFFFPDDLIY